MGRSGSEALKHRSTTSHKSDKEKTRPLSQTTSNESKDVRGTPKEKPNVPALPPGLYNLGNSCFFNSVFQALLATRTLEHLIRTPELYADAQRSPALINGRPRNSPVARAWENGMPISDTFLRTMDAAWEARDANRRASLSLRDLLMRLGQKFDQYLDFRQQDAHELLRHLLDAISTEELDMIRKRQPPPPKKKRRKHAPDAPMASDPPLVSFIDLVFGGMLASILVCSSCKRISVSHEPFCDLSLPLATEVRERRRDKIVHFASRIQNMQGFKRKISTKRVSAPPLVRDLGRNDAVYDERRAGDAHAEMNAMMTGMGLLGGAETSVTGPTGFGKLFGFGKKRAGKTGLDSATSSRPGTPIRTATPSPQPANELVSFEFVAPNPESAPAAPGSTPTSTSTPVPGQSQPAAPLHLAPSHSPGAMLSTPLDPLSRSRSPSRSRPASRTASQERSSVADRYMARVLKDAGPAADDAGPQSLLDALRAFTAVERLEGESMVGCGHCWRMAQKGYKPRSRSASPSSSSSSPSDDESSDEEDFPQASATLGRQSLSLLRTTSIHHRASASVASLPPLGSPREEVPDARDVESDDDAAVLSSSLASMPARRGRTGSSYVDLTSESVFGTPEYTSPAAGASHTPMAPRSSHQRERATDSPLMVGTPPASSSEPAPPAPQATPADVTPASVSVPNDSPVKKARPPKSQRSILRPTFKRYLLSRTPSVLVLHLKRFQQQSSTLSNPLRRGLGFSGSFNTGAALWGGPGAEHFGGATQAGWRPGGSVGGFRKVEEWIAFPEKLDMRHFMAPDLADPEKTPGDDVQYRLYAVVVHIGSMHGGHYIAYTALPDPEHDTTPVLNGADGNANGTVPGYTGLGNEVANDYIIVQSPGGTPLAPTETRSTSSSAATTVSSSAPSSASTATSPMGSTAAAASTMTSERDKDKWRSRQWCYISDTTVRLCNLEEVLRAKAYICFYERV